MKKNELIRILVDCFYQDEKEMREMTKEELEEMYRDLEDTSDMYPNGRDFDAEDEEC